MQRDKDLQPTEDGESGQQIAALEKLTRLRDPKQMENFLTYGKWDLKDADIEKLNKEEERKERVCLTIRFIYHRKCSKEIMRLIQGRKTEGLE